MTNCDNNPIISIVVPVYGTEQYFDRCIRSLQRQSYENLEIIVVNDGSKGNISALIKSYMEDPRIKYIDNTENMGLLMARVRGSMEATGEYIAFVDSDDYVSFDYYRTLLDKAESTNADIVIGKTVWVNGGEQYIYNYHEACFHFEALRGEQIRETFFGQEYQCYSWHTIWNKLYRKSLWNSCRDEFEKVNSHVIMTEDIFFSSLLFFNARYITHTDNDAYFYCVNDNASTNAKQITIERYCKNMSDIKFVFDAVENYLQRMSAAETVLQGVNCGRQHYARMWRRLAENIFNGEEQKRAFSSVDQLCKKLGKQKVQDDYYFESVKTTWNGGFEYIKERLRDSEQQYISFDIFDTLIKRPFYEPKDMFILLDEQFYKLSNNPIAFSKFRINGEELARIHYGIELGVEDLTLDEIYDFLVEHYGIKRNLAEAMKMYELDLEKKYCIARRSGVELLNLANTLGKKVILISDMYLNRETIESILKKCGIREYEGLYISSEERCLKYNGRLFVRALSDKRILSDNLIHIGDGWKSDIEGSSVVGIESIFFPKTIEIFENKIQGCITNRCADIGKESIGEHIDFQRARNSMTYRCMQAIAANAYFDNPYRTFNPDSDFNMDPYFIGFYLLGMHLTGMAKWIDSSVAESKWDNILFLARDGFLPMKGYEIYQQYVKRNGIQTQYIQVSRKALLPIMIKDVLNLYQLPIEYRAHTPLTLCSVLAFLMKTEYEEKLSESQNAGFVLDQPFKDLEEYHRFIRWLVEHLYDQYNHDIAREKVRRYYASLPNNAIAFDMGYSGRIQAALCEAIDHPVDVMFLHEDYETACQMKTNLGFEILPFYQYYPSVTGLIREHIFSECNGSCIGFDENEMGIVPVIEEMGHYYPDRYVINSIQTGALDFLKEFLENFSNESLVMSFSPEVVSIPFEGFLRHPSRNDIHIFSASYFEDIVFGAQENINIETFIMQNLTAIGWNQKIKTEIAAEQIVQAQMNDEDKRILSMINHNAQWKRAIIWLLMDWQFFKEKLSLNIRRLFYREKLDGRS